MHAQNAKAQYQPSLDKVGVVLKKVTFAELIVLLDDYNTHLSTDDKTWKGVIGRPGNSDINRNGRCLLQFCATNGLCIINTFFRHERIHNVHSVGQRSIIDFCIVSADLFSSVVRVKRRN